MQLPGRLRSTTLGDLLGALHRAGATGTLELIEDRGRAHHIHWMRGLVVAVEIDGASPSLAEFLRGEDAADADVLRLSLLRAIASRRLHGKVLIDEFRVPPARVGAALRRQMLARLSTLERLGDARLSFRVAVRPPRGALVGAERDAGGQRAWDTPLGAYEFLHGRRRARERTAAESHRGLPRSCASRAGGATAALDSTEAETGPWRILGLAPGSEVSAIKRAYRRLARSVHPDLHPEADDATRRSLQIRFVELTDAYRALVP